MTARRGAQVVFVALVLLALSGCAFLGIVPAISVYQGSTKIDNKGTFDFGSIMVSASTIPVDFTIKNTGLAKLDLTGASAIAIGGTNASNFTLQPGAATDVGGGSSGDFEIIFGSSSAAALTAAVTITGADGTTFSFTLTGTASLGT
jgi:hypothetical protein